MTLHSWVEYGPDCVLCTQCVKKNSNSNFVGDADYACSLHQIRLPITANSSITCKNFNPYENYHPFINQNILQKIFSCFFKRKEKLEFGYLYKYRGYNPRKYVKMTKFDKLKNNG